MLTPNQEKYVFRHLSLIDMERVEQSLSLLGKTDDPYLKEILFRDAVISYVKPFTDNRGKIKKRGYESIKKAYPKN